MLDWQCLVAALCAVALRQVELLAEMLGELDDRPQVNVLVTLERLAVRGTLLAALASAYDARAAVAAALLAVEGGVR